MQHLEVSCAVRPLKWPLGVKWFNYLQFAALNTVYIKLHQHQFVQNVLWGKENHKWLGMSSLLTRYGATKINDVLNMSLLH